MITVQKTVRAPITPALLRSAVAAAAALPEVARKLPASWDVAIRVGGDRALRQLNRRFAGEDHTTDVLSFPSGERGTGAHLGDLAISWPAVLRQAAQFGHPAENEAALLAVHGFLHLLGWHHDTPAAEREMWRLTEVALAAQGRPLAPGRLSSTEPARC